MATDAYSQIFSQISQTGQQAGEALEKNKDPFVSSTGSAMTTAFDPLKSMETSLAEGNKWWEVLGAASPVASGIMAYTGKKDEIAKEDARQRAFLEEINRKRKALESGRDYAYELANKQVQKGLAQTQQNILRSGSDIASIQQGLNIAQQNAGDQFNKTTAGLLSQQGIFTQMANEQIDKLAARKLNVEMQNYLQELYQKKNIQQASSQNLMGMLAYLLGNTGTSTDQTAATTPNENAWANTNVNTDMSPSIATTRNFETATPQGAFDYSNLYSTPNKYVTAP